MQQFVTDSFVHVKLLTIEMYSYDVLTINEMC